MKRILAAFLLMLSTAQAAEIDSLNITDASNTARFPENMAPSAVNDGARALEGIIARWYFDTNGTNIASGSTSNTIDVSATQTLTTYYDGLVFGFQSDISVTGATVLNVDNLGEKAIKKQYNQDLADGDINAGQKVIVVYDATNAVWQMLSQVGTSSALVPSNNLSDLTDAGAARTNLGFDGTSEVISSGDLDDTAKVASLQAIWIPAGACDATSVSGASAAVSAATAGPDVNYKAYDSSSDEFCQTQIAFPDSWNEGTVQVIVYWTQGNDDAGSVAWSVRGVAIADNGAIDTAYGTAVVVTDTAHAVTGDLAVSATSDAITIGGTPAERKLVYLQMGRDVSDGDDTLAADAWLIGFKVLFTLEAANDN